jgi:hypothetical protein
MDDAIDDIFEVDPGWAAIQRSIEHDAEYVGVLPPCVLSENYECDGCIAENVEGCPVGSDGGYRAYLANLRDSLIEHQIEHQKERAARIRLLQGILRRHKLPLHWEYIALLAMKEAPGLFESKESVRGFLFFNRDVFTVIHEGVFILAKYQL